jgi:hypothetical protein
VDNDYTRYTCYGCHEHSRSKIREEHLEEGIYQYENCVECHRSGDAEEGREGTREGGGQDRGEGQGPSSEEEDGEDEDHH